MKILFPSNDWAGGYSNIIAQEFALLGFNVRISEPAKPISILNSVISQQFVLANIYRDSKLRIKHNQKFLEAVTDFKPDIVITFSGGSLLPETMIKLKERIKCTNICVVADNPFDPWRDRFFGLTLQHYDILLIAEKLWIQNIRNVAPNSKIHLFASGFSPRFFFPINEKKIESHEIAKYQCDVSFTGGSYGILGEGNYRARILSQLTEFDLKIWGDRGWMKRGKNCAVLKESYQGDRLSYEDLRKLYTISKINLNMPSPQILTTFQPRVFEIAAVKGFQIIDYREEISNYFNDDEIVVFYNISDLKEKINYYLEHPKERQEIVEKLYDKVISEYTWEKQLAKIIQFL